MITVTGVGHRKLNRRAIVAVLCVIAVCLWVDAARHVRKVQRESEFRRVVVERVEELQRALDAIAK